MEVTQMKTRRENKKVKKLLALILTVLLCFGMLSACQQPAAESTSSTETTKPADTTQATETTQTTPTEHVNADIYPINFDGTLVAATGKTNADTMEFWTAWQEYTGVDIEWKVVNEETTALLFLSEEEMPDIFFQCSGLTLAQIQEYGRAGLVINFMDYLEKMPNLCARIAEDPLFLTAVKDVNGDVYNLPYYKDKVYTTPTHRFYVRTDMTKAAGWDELPTTIEGLLDLCEDLKNTYADLEGYYPISAGQGSYMKDIFQKYFLAAFGELLWTGITVNGDQTKIQLAQATEQFKYYLEFMHTLFEKEYISPDCFTTEKITEVSKFAEGLTTISPLCDTITPDCFASGELELEFLPAMSSAYWSEQRWPMLDPHYNSGTYMISSTCKDIDIALAFFDAFYADSSNPLNEEGTVWGASIAYGELGVNVVVDEDAGTYEFILPEGFETETAYQLAASTTVGPYIYWPYYSADGGLMELDALNYKNVLLPYAEKVFNERWLILTEEEQETYVDCWADINLYLTEMNAAFITGQKDIEAEWDNYIARLNEMGLQDVLDVYQAALDRFHAAQ